MVAPVTLCLLSCAVLQVLDSAVASVCPKAELIAVQAVAGPAERALYRAYAVPSLFGRDTLECGPLLLCAPWECQGSGTMAIAYPWDCPGDRGVCVEQH